MCLITLIDGELYQWDTGRIIQIDPENDYIIHEVHFTTTAMAVAYVVKTYTEDDITYCAVPNILLQQYQSIVCYEVRENEQGEETVSSTIFKVNKRNKPEDYIYTESEQYTYKQLESDFAELKASFYDVHDIAASALEMVETLSTSVVKSVNNIVPDENGNVTIEVGSGSSGEVDNVVIF